MSNIFREFWINVVGVDKPKQFASGKSPASQGVDDQPVAEASAPRPANFANVSAAGVAQAAGVAAPAANVKESLLGLPIPGLPDIPDPSVVCRIKVTNNTKADLKLDKGSINAGPGDHSGKFGKEPPDVIPAGQTVNFRAVNKPPFLAGAEGDLEYIIDDQNTRWFIRWENARVDLPTEVNEAPTHLSGPNKGKFAVDGNAGPKKSDDFVYTLTALGGGGILPWCRRLPIRSPPRK